MPEEDSLKKIDEVRFVYRKARHHRTFHADGIWAAVTPQLEVQFAFFNNLQPMPLEVVHKVLSDATLGEEIKREREQEIVREVDATVVMNKDTMIAAIELLQRMLAQIDKRIEFAKKEEEPITITLKTDETPPAAA